MNGCLLCHVAVGDVNPMITICAPCGARHDAESWFKNKLMLNKNYFIGKLDGLCQDEVEIYMQAFQSRCQELEMMAINNPPVQESKTKERRVFKRLG